MSTRDRRMRQSKSRSQKGFTLLEVLVALIVLGLGITFLSGTVFDSLMRAGRIDRDDRAAALADATLARLGNDIPLNEGITQGQAEGLFWRLAVAREPERDDVVPLDAASLTIFTTSGKIIGQWQTLRVAAQAVRQ